MPARSNGLLDGLTGGILIARHQSSLKHREPGDSQDGDQKQSHTSPQRSQEAQHHAIAITGNETPATILVKAVDAPAEQREVGVRSIVALGGTMSDTVEVIELNHRSLEREHLKRKAAV